VLDLPVAGTLTLALTRRSTWILHVQYFFVALMVTILVAVAMVWWLPDLQSSGSLQPTAALPHVVTVNVPALSGMASEGSGIFAAKCSACHGPKTSGGQGGPPLVHKIYEPDHRADGAFVMVVRRGVRLHYWKFGSMPQVDDVTEDDLRATIAYIRAPQAAIGFN